MLFISYATENAARARATADALEALGAEPWLAEREIEPTGNFVHRIEEALKKASGVLVLWSRAAAGSAWVQTERDSAMARRLRGDPMLLTALARCLSAPDERMRRAVRRLLKDGKARAPLVADHPLHQMFYEGLLRREGNRYYVPRCGAAYRLLKEEADEWPA